MKRRIALGIAAVVLVVLTVLQMDRPGDASRGKQLPESNASDNHKQQYPSFDQWRMKFGKDYSSP